MRRATVLALVACLGGGWGCVYYNGLWNAHKYARDARRAERNGQPDAAIASWGLSAIEAESVAVHHPHSGWAPDALITAAEGLAGAGDCAGALDRATRAVAISADSALLERAALVQARCAYRAGAYGEARALAVPVMGSQDRDRRYVAALLAGRAARDGGDPDSAATLLAHSPERAAGVEQVLALLEAGRIGGADSLCELLVSRRPLEDDWDSIFAAFWRTVGESHTSRVVGRVVPRTHLSSGARARLYLDDADRLLAEGDPGAADERFARAGEVAPDSGEADRAELGRLRVRVARFTNLDSLVAVKNALAPYTARGAAVSEARRLQRLLNALDDHDSTVTAAFRLSDLARDSLDADPLAAFFLLGFAQNNPRSVFAPKAILAALPLAAGRSDSLTGVLDAGYRTSPYTLALHGAASPEYVTAEDSLGRLFGLQSVRALPNLAARESVRWAVPRTGKRGPLLEPDLAVAAAPVRPPVARPSSGRRGVTPADTVN